MKVRWKLLILLLVIALVPLIGSAALQRASMQRLGAHIASDTSEVLAHGAQQLLLSLVRDYGRLLERDKATLELAVKFQAREAERSLAEGPPPSPRLFYSEDFDKGVNLPEGMVESAKHFRTGPNGEQRPIDVTYADMVCFVVNGADPKAVAQDLACLSTMPEGYRFVYDFSPDLIYWQYTSMESGCHTSFPGHGGYPPDYDPRIRPWYQATKAAGELTWLVMPEVSTRTVTQLVAMPVRRADGSFGGVTAIDVPFESFFKELSLPRQWALGSEAVLVAATQSAEPAGGTHRLNVLVARDYEQHGDNWRVPVALRYLESEDSDGLGRLTERALAGESGVERMPYLGRDALWVHGAGHPEEPFPVVIVPYDVIVAQAANSHAYILQQTVRGLRVTGIVLLAVAVLVSAVALASSRSVTQPVQELARAARELADGDYGARAAVHTGDELQELGEVFNDIGPKLREREELKRSLLLAAEIQQHLLPDESPRLPGFDIVGETEYCDETGGDYYDFIRLVGLGDDMLGIAVGDVSGHGVGAALLMASARAILRSLADQHERDLGKLFGTLNRDLARDVGEARFMTMFYAVLDASHRRIWCASGGHDPAFWLRRSSGQIEEFGDSGFPLGLVDDAEYSECGPLAIDSGDVIAIGTDGIWETRNAAGEMFGKDRVRNILASSADGSARRIYDTIVDAVSKFRGDAAQTDDVTLVVLKSL